MKAERSAAVIGGGKMGADIAAVFASGGWQAHVSEPSAEVRATLPQRTRGALKTLGARAAAARSVHVHATLEAIPWRAISLVVEAVPEDLALKQRLFADIEKLARRSAILTTNSSSLKLTEVVAKVRLKARTAAMHWLTPAHIAPIVEVVRGKQTSAATIARLNAWLAELGKLAINLNRDVPGMLVNRVQHAMMREAFDLIDRGIVTPEDVDAAVRFGFGFRYVACGPVRQRDLNGLTIHLQSAAQIYPTLHAGKKPPRCLSDLVTAGHVGVRAGRGFYRWDERTLPAEVRRIDRLMGKALELMADDREALTAKAPARRRRRQVKP
jgi:3-hydroxybutyryl-CoA dehydrogenase